MSTALDLDAPLPAEIAGRHQGWFTRYRRYRVFSRPWVRGRLLTVGLAVLLAFVFLVMPAFFFTDDGLTAPLGGLLHLALELFLPLLLGPWLALQIRRRAWPAPREWAALVALMLLMMAVPALLRETLAEPMKQWVAEQQGLVDASGKRRRMVMGFGFFIADGERGKRQAEPSHNSPGARLASHATLSVLVFLLAGGLGLSAWRREQHELAALLRERELAQAQAARHEAELRLSVLAAQVEPHFLFNTLAGVRSAISTDPARASELIDRLVDYLRAAIPRLRSDGQLQATLGAQLDIVRAYLKLMSTRLPRLQWQIDAAPQLLTAACPPLILISLVENAVKHGVERKRGPAQIRVRAERAQQPGQAAHDRLRISVADDGPGFGDSVSGGGLGLVNIRERLATLYGSEAGLSLSGNAEGGVTATLELPYVQRS
jgi:two-component sensor histidine kinase